MTTFIAAFFVLLVFSGATWFLLGRYAKKHPYAKRIFLFALCVHAVAAFGIYYTEFYPFGMGDQERYQTAAELVASDFRAGVFSLDRISSHLYITSAAHWYPVVLGSVYAVSVPDRLVGMVLNAWIAALSILIVFFLALEISKSSRGAFWAGVVASLYPAHVYFGSLLLKDATVVLLALAGLLFAVKIMQRFSPRYVIAFGIALALLFHFRFYIGVALLYAFSFSWPFIRGFTWKQKVQYGTFTLLSLGLIPSFLGYGYYALDIVAHYTRIDQIELYRESAYIFENSPDVQVGENQGQGVEGSTIVVEEEVAGSKPEAAGLASVQGEEQSAPKGAGGSTVIVKVGDGPLSFIRNYLVSLSFVSLGPFPWHFSLPQHYFAFVEVIPWWILLFFIVLGVRKRWREWQVFLPLLLFALGTLVMLALLIDNFGIYMRLRMPVFLVLLAFLAVPLSRMSKNQLYEIIRYWRRRFHRLA
ncbi:MAG TPA: hypothetical protein VFE94_03920 [Candidatus Paceibacterota bacterium]|nr:hypothetical protein [Candidatus Paceibacterota bacterium]